MSQPQMSVNDLYLQIVDSVNLLRSELMRSLSENAKLKDALKEKETSEKT